LWLGSCVLTGSPNISRPAQDKPARAPTQSSETQEAADKSPSGQGDPQQTAKGERKEASGKSSSSPETSPQTAGNESQHAAETQPGAAAQKDAASRPDSPGMADSKLAEARHNLQISEATENRIAAELEQLKNSGSATPETIKNYEDYHASVKEMVAENRRILARMEAAKARHSSAPTSSATTGRGEIEGMLNPEIPEAQTTDEVAALDRQLNASLGEFDTRLLEEMDQIRGQSAARMRDLAREAAEAAKRLREKGVDVNTSAAASSQTSEKNQRPQQRQHRPSKARRVPKQPPQTTRAQTEMVRAGRNRSAPAATKMMTSWHASCGRPLKTKPIRSSKKSSGRSMMTIRGTGDW